MLFYEESYTQIGGRLQLIPLGVILVSVLAWKLFFAWFAIVIIAASILIGYAAYLFRHGGVRVEREQILLHGGFQHATIPLNTILEAQLVERRHGTYVLPGTVQPLTTRIVPLPFSLSSLLFLERGVLITPTDSSKIHPFIYSASPEQLLKAIKDAKDMT